MQPSSYRFYYHTISFHYLCRRFSWVKMSDRVRCKVLLGIVAIKAPRRMFWSCLATFAATDRILEAAWLPNSACTPVHFYNNKWTLWFLTFWSVLRSKLQAPVVNLTTLFLGRLRPPNQYFVHILSPVSDNCLSWKSGRRNESTLPDRVSNPGPLTYESGALPIALRGPASWKEASDSG